MPWPLFFTIVAQALFGSIILAVVVNGVCDYLY